MHLQEVPLLSTPFVAEQSLMTMAGNGASKASMMIAKQADGRAIFSQKQVGGVMEMDSMSECQHNTLSAEHYGSTLRSTSFRHRIHDIYEGIALPDYYLHDYFAQVGNQGQQYACCMQIFYTKTHSCTYTQRF